MRDAVVQSLSETDVLVMAAAVADYEPAEASDQKIKKDGQSLSLDLAPTPDILAEVTAMRGESKHPFIVGFAAETEQLLENARAKLDRKGMDLLVANDVSLTDSGFGSDYNTVTLLNRDGSQTDLPRLTKIEVSHRIWDEVLAIRAALAP